MQFPRLLALVFVIACTCLYFATAFAAPTCPNAHPVQPDWKFCEICGARIVPPDAAEGRIVQMKAYAASRDCDNLGRVATIDHATRLARANGIRQQAGRELGAGLTSEARKAITLLGTIHADRYIQHCRVGKAVYKNGVAQVWIAANVRASLLRRHLRVGLQLAPSVVVVIDETMDGASVNAPQMQPAVTSALLSSGCRLFPIRDNQVSRWQGFVAPVLSGNVRAVVDEYVRSSFDVIVVGEAAASFSQNNQGIISYRANGTFCAVDAEMGEILLTKQISEVRGFGKSRHQAGRAALASLAGQMAAYVGPAVSGRDSDATQLRIIADGIGGPEHWDAIVQQLHNISAITQLDNATCTSGTASVSCLSKVPALALSLLVNDIKGLRVTDYTQESIRIQASQ